MQNNNQQQYQDLTELSLSGPSVSILLPFEPQMKAKPELNRQLQEALDKAESVIREQYDDDLGMLVVRKLRNLIGQLNFNSFKKSIAIYASPMVEKIIYLDIPIRQRVSVSNGFEIREIIHAKKEDKMFLLLNLSSRKSTIYLGDGKSLSRLSMNDPGHSAAFQRGLPEKVANFSDESSVKEIVMEKFLHHTDQALHLLLQAYPFPVFVTGVPSILGHFRRITRNEMSLVKYIPGNYIDNTVPELMEMLKPELDDWQRIRFKDLQHQFEAAADSGKLVRGIRDVWKQAKRRNARLLVVEDNFSPVAILHPSKGERAYSRYSVVKNTVDDIIEEVLEAGGDVEIMESGSLSNYDHILLIEKYAQR